MQSRLKKFFLAFIISIVISVIIMPLRGIPPYKDILGIYLCSILGYTFYFFFTVFFLKKSEKIISGKFVLLAILMGIGILQLPTRIIYFQRTLFSLPDFLMHILGIISGYIAHKRKPCVKWSIGVAGFVFCLFMFFKGYDYWYDKRNYGTFLGIIDDNVKYNFTFQTSNGDTLSLFDFKGKYILLDCWFTYCQVCYQKMPEMQKLYDSYKESNDIIICSMHCYMKDAEKKFNGREKNEDYSTGSQILHDRDYTFPCWTIDIDDPVLKELGVEYYPTVLIFDKESKLVFRGDIKTAKKYIEKIIK